jgi:hypothetical protein
VFVPSDTAQQWILVTSLILRAFVSTSNVTIEKDLEVSAVAEVKEVLKLGVVELVASVIGLEKGLTDAPSFFSGSKGCHL